MSIMRCWICPAVLVFTFGCVSGCNPTSQIPTGDAERGAELWANGDGTGPGCGNCHCPDGTGGCRLGAPSLVNESYEEILRRTRNPDVPHPGAKFDFTDQDVADLEAFVATLSDADE